MNYLMIGLRFILFTFLVLLGCTAKESNKEFAENIESTSAINIDSTQNNDCQFLDRSDLSGIDNLGTIVNLKKLNGIKALKFSRSPAFYGSCINLVDSFDNFKIYKTINRLMFLESYAFTELIFYCDQLVIIQMDLNPQKWAYDGRLQNELEVVFGKPNSNDKQIDSVSTVSGRYTFNFFNKNDAEDFSESVEEVYNSILFSQPIVYRLPELEDITINKVKNPNATDAKYDVGVDINEEEYNLIKNHNLNSPPIIRKNVNINYLDYIKIVSTWKFENYALLFQIQRTSDLYQTKYEVNNPLKKSGYAFYDKTSFFITYTVDENYLSLFQKAKENVLLKEKMQRRNEEDSVKLKSIFESF